jgi:hypothetical protein
MRSETRICGKSEVEHELKKMNNNFTNILSIPSHIMSTEFKIQYTLEHINIENIEIFRIQTPIGTSFTLKNMQTFIHILTTSHIWGLNLGEFHATDDAWIYFANNLHKTTVGFIWINERGKSIGSTTKIHDWLLGVEKFKDCGVFRGRASVLSMNRKKFPLWYKNGTIQPWYDCQNSVLKHALAKKFLFNPHNSRYFV